ncbi:MAG: 3-hydroxyacyl-CoA dehydrogenase NAD-binding domain-containing protein [Desulfobacterales bacterium]|nr:3-hydroxyacyl-CoA dehydrogenase NAD-binding domain-containing protein [Desulfobacterales bacterium]
MSIKTVAVIGSGLMGHGIAQVAAMSGQEVSLIDISDDLLTHAMTKIGASLEKLERKGKLTTSCREIEKRIHPRTDIKTGVLNADFIIEAVLEDITIKQNIFRAVETHAPDHAIIATNTSGLSVTAISDAIENKERAIGMHWMNPPQLMKLVEIVRSRYTTEQTFKTTLELCAGYHKETVLAQKDVWYFLATRARAGFSFEANLMYLQRKASVVEIDTCIRNQLGLPMGEFELMDLTGAVDIRTKGMQSTEAILKTTPEFEPWPAFVTVHRYLVDNLWGPMSAKGLSGVKTGKGFYDYKESKLNRAGIAEEKSPNPIHPLEILAPGLNCAAWCVTNGVGSVEDVNRTFRFAFNWPKGIFEYIDDYGIDRVLAVLRAKRETALEVVKDFYQADPLLLNWPK